MFLSAAYETKCRTNEAEWEEKGDEEGERRHGVGGGVRGDRQPTEPR